MVIVIDWALVRGAATALKSMLPAGGPRGDRGGRRGFSNEALGLAKEVTRYFNTVNHVMLTAANRGSITLPPKESTEWYQLLVLAFLSMEDFLKDENTGPNHELMGFVSLLNSIDKGMDLSRVSDPVFCLSITHSFPTYFIHALLRVTSLERVGALMDEMNNNDTFFVNCATSGEVQAMKAFLRGRGFTHRSDAVLPRAIHVRNVPGAKRAVRGHVAACNIRCLFQDLGSAAAVNALGLTGGETVLDCCAAPLQKSIMAGWQAGPAGRVVALDVDAGRLSQNVERARLLAGSAISPVNADGFRLPALGARARPDKLLIDAPCTGSGALYASPELKWRQGEALLEQSTGLQRNLLRAAIGACKENRWDKVEIVYSTCSLYPQEGEEMIDSFLDEISLVDLHDRGKRGSLSGFSMGWPGFQSSRFVARTFPDLHGGAQGFFIARFTVP